MQRRGEIENVRDCIGKDFDVHEMMWQIGQVVGKVGDGEEVGVVVAATGGGLEMGNEVWETVWGS